jgi:VWFA-related protein
VFHLSASRKLLLLILASSPALAQEIRVSSRPYVSSSFVLRVDTNLVEAGVVVRGPDGHAVAGLTRGDFRIFDEGKEREITAFSINAPGGSENGAPLPGGVSTATAKGAAIGPTSSRSAAEARYVALLFDDVHTRPGDISHVRAAAGRFIREALQPGDQVAIFTTSGVEVLAFTADVPKLIGAIEKLGAHPRFSENGLMPCPRITPYQAYLIVSMDGPALQAALDEAHACVDAAEPTRPSAGLPRARPSGDITFQQVRVQAEQTWDQAKMISQNTLDEIGSVVDELAKMPGRRVLLLASPGFLAETLEYDQSRIIDRALAANVVINALDAKGLFAETPFRTSDQLAHVGSLPLSTMVFEERTQPTALETANSPLINVALSTGGMFFHNSNDLNLGFRQLAAVPEITYRLGFVPGGERDGHFHKLQVKLTNPNSYVVQARRGYVIPARETGQATAERQQLDRAVSASGEVSDLPASVKIAEGKSKSGQPALWVSVHVDLKELRFTERDGRHLQGLIFVTALLDANGDIVTAKEGRMDLELKQPTFARLMKNGVNANVSMEAPPGAYRLREVVREAVAGRMAASSQEVRIK